MKLFRKLFARSHSDASTGSTRHTVPSAKHGETSGLSPTPLTEQEVGKILQSGQVQKVSAEFARQLERQLNELNERKR
jgi:hypothetical protein